MNEQLKYEIKAQLDHYVEKYPSQAKAFATIKNASEALLIGIRKNRWENISDEMWRNVSSQIGMGKNREWKIVTTTTGFKNLHKIFTDSQEQSAVFATIAQEGYGKSSVAEFLSQNSNQNIYWIECAEYFNKKTFLTELCIAMNIDDTGTIYTMMNRIIKHLRKVEKPLIIIDEVDKLTDAVLYFFITLCNKLKDKCGITIMATAFLEKRFDRGIRLRKKGYAEMYSRMGRKFVPQPQSTLADVTAVCEANGLYEQEDIMKIYNEYEGDFRRVKRLVQAYFIKLSKKTA